MSCPAGALEVIENSGAPYRAHNQQNSFPRAAMTRSSACLLTTAWMVAMATIWKKGASLDIGIFHQLQPFVTVSSMLRITLASVLQAASSSALSDSLRADSPTESSFRAAALSARKRASC